MGIKLRKGSLLLPLLVSVLALVEMGYGQSDERGVTEEFKNILVRKNAGRISIEIPKELSEERNLEVAKLFQDVAKTKSVVVQTLKCTPVGDKAQEMMVSEYKKNPELLFDQTERIERLNIGRFKVLAKKGIKKNYIFDYEVETDQSCTQVTFLSPGDYFLTDDEVSYIISTIQGLE